MRDFWVSLSLLGKCGPLGRIAWAVIVLGLLFLPFLFIYGVLS